MHGPLSVKIQENVLKCEHYSKPLPEDGRVSDRNM
jgi:hypothetical protein